MSLGGGDDVSGGGGSRCADSELERRSRDCTRAFTSQLDAVRLSRHKFFTGVDVELVRSVCRSVLFTTTRSSSSAKKTNEWVPNKAGVKRELLGSVKARKLAYYGHTVRKQGSCLEKETMQGTMTGARRRGRPRTAWMDNIKTCTGLSVEESVRMTENRDKWRKYVHGVANPRIEDG